MQALEILERQPKHCGDHHRQPVRDDVVELPGDPRSFGGRGELGLLGLTADPEHGGAGMDATAQVDAISRQTESAWEMADKMAYDEIIDPRDLRNALLDGLILTQGRSKGPFMPRPHGILP